MTTVSAMMPPTSSMIASSFTVGPSPAVILFSIVMAAAFCAGIITALKGHWLWLIAGLLTSGLAFFYSAVLPPAPDSLWARGTTRRGRA
jgi:hypothetical protein